MFVRNQLRADIRGPSVADRDPVDGPL